MRFTDNDQYGRVVFQRVTDAGHKVVDRFRRWSTNLPPALAITEHNNLESSHPLHTFTDPTTIKVGAPQGGGGGGEGYYNTCESTLYNNTTTFKPAEPEKDQDNDYIEMYNTEGEQDDYVSMDGNVNKEEYVHVKSNDEYAMISVPPNEKALQTETTTERSKSRECVDGPKYAMISAPSTEPIAYWEASQQQENWEDVTYDVVITKKKRKENVTPSDSEMYASMHQDNSEEYEDVIVTRDPGQQYEDIVITRGRDQEYEDIVITHKMKEQPKKAKMTSKSEYGSTARSPQPRRKKMDFGQQQVEEYSEKCPSITFNEPGTMVYATIPGRSQEKLRKTIDIGEFDNIDFRSERQSEGAQKGRGGQYKNTVLKVREKCSTIAIAPRQKREDYVNIHSPQPPRKTPIMY